VLCLNIRATVLKQWRILIEKRWFIVIHCRFMSFSCFNRHFALNVVSEVHIHKSCMDRLYLKHWSEEIMLMIWSTARNLYWFCVRQFEQVLFSAKFMVVLSLLGCWLTKYDAVFHILTRSACFPFEHRMTESVCYYAIKSLLFIQTCDDNKRQLTWAL
jgi:hypothetical protein